MKVGILAAGGIANKMATTLKELAHPEIELYAIASRSQERAEEFAHKYDMPRAYSSYKELAQDPYVDLIYIASPHSEHFAHGMLCLEHKKPILVEKAFTANATSAKALLEYAKSQHVLATEAIWTRYMPSRQIICDALASGKLGVVHSVQANLCYPIAHKDRIILPELAGGALLDIGVYTINFAMMFLGSKVTSVKGKCLLSNTGVDLVDNISLICAGGPASPDSATPSSMAAQTGVSAALASLHVSAFGPSDRNGIIYGTKGYMVVTNINNPEKVEIFNQEHELIEELPLPKQVTGFEYQVISCFNALKEGRIECPEMPHKETIAVMGIMDKLREHWGVTYPFE